MEYIPKDQLITGKTYVVDARAFMPDNDGLQRAKWNGKDFVGRRNKFGSVFEDTELHYDDDPRYGTVKPLYLAE